MIAGHISKVVEKNVRGVERMAARKSGVSRGEAMKALKISAQQWYRALLLAKGVKMTGDKRGARYFRKKKKN
jgi:hypothetical protein